MRMALSETTPGATAVLNSILALASLYKDGFQPQAARLKLDALEALMTSTKNGIDVHSAIQHTAVGMLLSCFEVSSACHLESKPSFLAPPSIRPVLRARAHTLTRLIYPPNRCS